MKPEDVSEEHRKYLEIKDNPVKVSNASIFSLLSDGLVKLQERIGIIEVKQEQMHEDVTKLDSKLERQIEKRDNQIEVIEDDFRKCQMSGFRQKGPVHEERLRWQDRMLKGILALTISTIGLILYLHFGIAFP